MVYPHGLNKPISLLSHAFDLSKKFYLYFAYLLLLAFKFISVFYNPMYLLNLVGLFKQNFDMKVGRYNPKIILKMNIII